MNLELTNNKKRAGYSATSVVSFIHHDIDVNISKGGGTSIKNPSRMYLINIYKLNISLILWENGRGYEDLKKLEPHFMDKEKIDARYRIAILKLIMSFLKPLDIITLVQNAYENGVYDGASKIRSKFRELLLLH